MFRAETRRLVVSTAFLTAAAVAFACGSSVIEAPGRAEGEGGGGASGGAPAGTGGAGGDVGGGSQGAGGTGGAKTWDDYCAAHAEISCERAFACSPVLAAEISRAADAEQCRVFRTRECLAAFALEDAASVEARWACLEAWPLDCAAYVGVFFGESGGFRVPPCPLPGERPLGASCFGDAQCQSLFCKRSTGEPCGTCFERQPEGYGCMIGPCEQGLICHLDTCFPAVSEGSFCSELNIGFTQVCVNATCHELECKVPALAGEACGEVGCETRRHECIDGVCVAEETLPVGAPCPTSGLPVCAGGSCVQGTCTAWLGLGEACQGSRCEPGLSCVEGQCTFDEGALTACD